MGRGAPDARSALDQVERARSDMGERVGSPAWFHVGLGVLVAQHALVSGLAGGNWTIPSFVALVGGAAVLVALARRAGGVTVAWPRGPRSRGLMAARALTALACIWGATLVEHDVVIVFLAAVAVLATTLLGIAYDAALRHDIRGGHAGS